MKPRVGVAIPKFLAMLLVIVPALARADAPSSAQQTRQAFLAIIDRPKVDL